MKCSRCGFADDARIPVGADGLCLWCRKALEGVALADFYESGEWSESVDWRGYVDGGIGQLCNWIEEKRVRRGDTYIAVAREMGLPIGTLRGVMLRRTAKPASTTIERIARYLDMSSERVMGMIR